MRPGRRADAIEGVADVGDPVAQSLVHRVLQRPRARLHGADLGAQHLHAEHVRLLPLDVDRAHVDDAGQAEARAGGRGGDAVLAGARLGDDARLAHPPREQDLAHHVVDLVRAGVIELVALEIDFCAAEMRGHPLGEIERARPADIVLEEVIELALKARVGLGRLVRLLQREDQRHQGFRHEAAAKNAEMAALVGSVAIGIGLVDLGHRKAPRFARRMALRRDAGADFSSASSDFKALGAFFWALWPDGLDISKGKFNSIRHFKLLCGDIDVIL